MPNVRKILQMRQIRKCSLQLPDTPNPHSACREYTQSALTFPHSNIHRRLRTGKGSKCQDVKPFYGGNGGLVAIKTCV